jgi:coenzyme PQQ precursor peptide PqqA
MTWEKPTVCEICVGMEVTGYESADLETDTDLFHEVTAHDND